MKLNNNKLTLAICVALSLSACSPNKTADEYIASAKAYTSNNQNPKALIELKNAIRSDMKNPEARLLLGSLYLQRGEAAVAEKELKKALMLGSSDITLIPKLLKSFELQGKNDESIELADKYKDLPAEILPEILLYQALAYTRIGEQKKAIAAVSQANEISIDSVYSQLGNAYVEAESSNIDGALSTLESILVTTPDFTEALFLQGQLWVIKKDFAAAIISFENYFKLSPADIKIRLYLANAYIKNQQFDEAEQHIDFILKIAPEHGLSNQLKGLVYYNREDYKQTLMHTEKAIQNGMNIPSNRVIAGLSAFQLKEYERAHQFLVTIVDKVPGNHPAKRVFAIVQMQLGYTEDAGETLSRFDGSASSDVNLFTSASFELMSLGKTDEAKLLLNKADDLVADDAEGMARIGILKLSMNDLDGMADLEKATQISPDSSVAKTALAGAYIQNKEFDKALALGEKWKKSQPEEVAGYNLVAKVLLLQDKIVAAESELKRALIIKDSNSLSILYFAAKAITESKPDESIGLLDKLLKTKPNHIKALALYYRAHKLTGNESIAINKVARSFSDNKNNPAYRLLYTRVLFIEQDFEKVIELLKNIDDKEAMSALHWGLLSDSYLNTKQSAKALITIDHWIDAKPQHRAAWLRKVSIQEKLSDFDGALSTVDSVLSFMPKDAQFNTLRCYYLIRNKQFNIAQTQIDNLDKDVKASYLVQGLQGQIWLTEGKYSQALTGLRGLHAKIPTAYNTSLVFVTLKGLKKEKDAFDFLARHVESKPNDFISRALLAENAVAYDKNLAKKHYLVLVGNKPNDLSVLNNLAWIEYELSNYRAADELSTRALKINNDNPQVLDTAGLIKLKLGNKTEAAALLKKANQLAPDDKVIAQHYKEVMN